MSVSYSEQEMLPISYIRQYLFCPRIPWYKHVMAFEPPEQHWVSHGKEWHDNQVQHYMRRVCRLLELPYTKRTNVYLCSTVLGIHGYADEVISNEAHQSVIVEYKVDRHKPTRGQILQLVGYALALEQSTAYQVVCGIMLKGHGYQQYQIPISAAYRSDFKQVLEKLRQALRQARLPASDAQEAQCSQCEYLRYCNDR